MHAPVTAEAALATIEHRAQRFETPLPGRPLVWRAWGEGPALVLLHGGYGSWMHWVRNVEALARTRRVLVPDMPGFGESGDAQDPLTAHGIAAPVAAGIDRLIGANAAFDIAAFSFGGSIAGLIAASSGARVGRLALVGSGGLRLGRAPPVNLQSSSHLDDAAAIAEVHRSNLALFMFNRAATIDPLALHIQAENVARARVKSRRISRMGVLHDQLPQIKAHLIGIWGEEDVIAKGHLHEREALLKAIDPNAEFHRIAAAGHWVQYEAADAFNAILTEAMAPA